MSFNNYVRKARDPGLSPWRRLSKLRGAIAELVWLTGEPYREALARLDARFRFDRRRETGGAPPSDETLRAAFDAIEVERNAYLERLRAFERMRIRRKARGNRHLSRAEREMLASLRQRATPEKKERQPSRT